RPSVHRDARPDHDAVDAWHVRLSPDFAKLRVLGHVCRPLHRRRVRTERTREGGDAGDVTRRVRHVVTAAAAVLMSVAATLGLLLAADVYAHGRADRSAGLNRWGYRGPVVGRKLPGEARIVMLGGSTAFGYGVTWDRAIPAQLERRLRARRKQPTTVVNLGYN